MANRSAANEDVNYWNNHKSIVQSLTDDGTYNNQSSNYLLINENGLVASIYNHADPANHHHDPHKHYLEGSQYNHVEYNHVEYSQNVSQRQRSQNIQQLQQVVKYQNRQLERHQPQYQQQRQQMPQQQQHLKQMQQQLQLQQQQQQQNQMKQQQEIQQYQEMKHQHQHQSHHQIDEKSDDHTKDYSESIKDQISLPVTIINSNRYVTNHDIEIRPDKSHSHNYVIEGIGLFDFLTWLKSVCGFILSTGRFQMLILISIIVNALTMGIATLPFIEDNPQRLHIFQTVDLGFLILFTIELVMQFTYRGFGLFNDGWLAFDFVIVLTSWIFSQLQIIRALRVLRVARLVTKLKGLQDIVMALISVIPRMIAIIGLMTLVYYIYAVMFTQLFGSAFDEGITTIDYFSRIDKTWFSLFQLMTMDSWSTVTRELMTVYPWAWLPMMTYIMSTSFIVINLIIAVICDAMSKLNYEHEIKEETQNKANYNVLMENHDEIARLERKIDHLTSLVVELVSGNGEKSSRQLALMATNSTEGHAFT